MTAESGSNILGGKWTFVLNDVLEAEKIGKHKDPSKGPNREGRPYDIFQNVFDVVWVTFPIISL